MYDIKIRYNTNCKDNHLFWRVLINGNDHLASNVIINVPVHTTRDIVYDSIKKEMVDKHHLSCEVKEVLWKGDVVILN
jgi:deoxyribodipyrimidine photolyase-like uncharacterized protein